MDQRMMDGLVEADQPDTPMIFPALQLTIQWIHRSHGLTPTYILSPYQTSSAS